MYVSGILRFRCVPTILNAQHLRKFRAKKEFFFSCARPFCKSPDNEETVSTCVKNNFETSSEQATEVYNSVKVKSDVKGENSKSSEVDLAKNHRGPTDDSNCFNDKTDRILNDDVKMEKDKTTQAKEKLLSLLSDMTGFNEFSDHSSKLQLTKPPQRLRLLSKAEVKENSRNKSEETFEGVILSAVKGVASVAPGNAEEIESELTEGITAMGVIKGRVDSPPSLPVSSADDSYAEPEVNESVISTVKAIASSVSGDSERSYSELVKKLFVLADKKEDPGSQVQSIEDVFDGLKIEKQENKASSFSETDPTSKRLEKHRRFTSEQAAAMQNIDIFSSPALDVFNLEDMEPRKEEIPESSTLQIWKRFQEKERKLLVEFAPSNAFEEMIKWTEQGKHWKFPIDNEIDMGAEEDVSFHEHVFLDRHLKGFPKRGPIRHFMELVITGLSKNPHISVERKIENVEWFRLYFKEKESILIESGALDDA